jgi:hypothetical protein
LRVFKELARMAGLKDEVGIALGGAKSPHGTAAAEVFEERAGERWRR